MTKASDVGHGKPPSSTRFRKGQSGNPKGRPSGRHRRPPYESVLGLPVTLKEDGVERQITAAEAFLLHITKRGLAGDGAAARGAMAAIEEARSARVANGSTIDAVVIGVVEPGSVNSAVEPLRMGTKLDRHRPSARMMLEPWLVNLALSRLGGRRLSAEEQATIVRAVRTPHKVRWPDWWQVRP